MENIVTRLAESEVFSQFSEQERKELAATATRRVLEKGERICFQGDHWPFVFYIARGVLRSIIGTPDGRAYVVYHWEQGEEFWSHSLLDGDPMPSTLEAHEETIIYQWPGETALAFLLRNPQAVRALLKRQTRLIRKRRENIYNLAFNPVASRLAKLVVEQFVDAESPTVQRDLTLEDMAAMVASSPEVICRVLYQFQDQGFIHVDRATITMKDRSSLEGLIIHD